MTEFQGGHAADRGAVFVVVDVAAADAVDQGHALRLGLAVAQDDLAPGRAGGVAQPLELHVGVDIGQAAVAVLRQLARIEQLPARGQDDVAYLDLDDLILLVEVDGLGGAEFFAGPAFAALEPDARSAVDDRNARHGLGEGRVNRLAKAHAGLEVVIDHLARAFFGADAAAGAGDVVDVAGLLADLHLEIAHRAGHFFQFGVGQELDLGVLAGLGHFRGQDAG